MSLSSLLGVGVLLMLEETFRTGVYDADEMLQAGRQEPLRLEVTLQLQADPWKTLDWQPACFPALKHLTQSLSQVALALMGQTLRHQLSGETWANCRMTRCMA